ncbi:MAG: hypothetical protein ABR553_07660 [Gammaproteobacteria bacterium]
MTSINLRPDDSGLQSLKRDNTTSPIARAVSALLPSAATRPVSGFPPTPPETPPRPQYTGPERRRDERRKAQQRVILDTRDKRERRRINPIADEPEREEPRGIDDYG